MDNKEIIDIAIIGAGPAGLTAGIYGARAGLNTVIFAGAAPGGQLLQTTDIENFPGFTNPISGFELMDKMIKQAKRLGTKVLSEEVKDLSLEYKPFKIFAGSKEYWAKTIIISTGASAKWLGLPTEEKFLGKGVSACATCDGFFYKDKEVCVIGGGDTAAEDALFLTKFAKKVYLIHRRDQLRSAYILQEKIKANSKIEILYSNIVKEIKGNEKVEGILIENIKTKEQKEIPISGIFIAIGHHSNTELFKCKVKMDEDNYIITDSNFETSVKGVWAAGDVRDRNYKQAIVAAGTGCMAAMNAIKYLELQG